MGVAPFIAALAVLLDRKGLLSTGPMATWSELSAALALLLAGSVLAQVLAYAALLVVNVLEGSRDAEIARSFTNAFFVARIPVLMFMAVQAALLPRLARLAASDAHLDFRTAFKRLLAVVLGVAALGTVVAWTIGPFVGRLLFSPEKFQISNFDLGVLAAGSGAFIIGQTIAQALIAMKRYWHVSISLFLGCVAFGVGIAAMPNVHTTLRARAAFFAGSLVASVVMLALVQKDLRGPIPESGLDLVRSIEQEAIDI
jgi:O-antigen/teichoic acid export membrane protein